MKHVAFKRAGDGDCRESLWAAETDRCAGEESRLKAGCSQDWLPHKVLQNQCTGRGFLESNLRRRASPFIGRGNLIRRPRAANVSLRQAGRPVAHCIDTRKTTMQNQRVTASFWKATCAGYASRDKLLLKDMQHKRDVTKVQNEFERHQSRQAEGGCRANPTGILPPACDQHEERSLPV